MEVFAGFVEHTDTEVGRLIDGIDARGLGDNTLIFYIFGDNSYIGGGPARLDQRAPRPEQHRQHRRAADCRARPARRPSGARRAGDRQHVPRRWAWAGGTPFKGTKLLGGYFGGTRNPMVVAWPGHIEPDGAMRLQFAHVVDIAPTIYEVLDITPPQVVNGFEQMPIDGASLVPTFPDPAAPEVRHEQFFDNNGSRGSGRMAGSPAPSGRSSRGTRRVLRSASPPGIGRGRVGALRPSIRLLPGPRPRRRAAGEAGGDEDALPRAGQ